MKVTVAGLIVVFWAAFAGAEKPDLRDSIIIESKTVFPGAHKGGASDTAAYLYLRVFITNKDSLTALTLALEERSASGGAYAILGYPRSFTGVINRLTETLGGSRVFSVGNGPGSRYNGKSPDSMLIAGLFDPMEPATIEPPNRVRKAFWEIKFDTVWAPAGKVEIDTARVVQSTGFTTTNPRDLPVNFVKGVLTVAPKGKPKK